ncbi:MAG: serine/threonine protein kinase, partial [Myxococcota bacterium]|nr:serine/threonine protein kinase [Myxococcota bacterium]
MRDLADELLRAKVKARLFGGDQAPRLGRLVILDRLGSGGMGTVYAAYDPRLDRRVAVKLLHAAGSDANARMLREARALGKLAHPNVIAIHDADEQDGTVHVVMELVTGVPLRTWISTPRAWRDVLRVMREAGAGLAAAHRAGLVHRDIKPDNILVGDDRSRVVDFGLADADAESELSDGAGTPNYMAPEVLAGEAATIASDQFSFGVTLYEALHGERPHVGTTRAELLEAARNAASARPSRTRVERPVAGPSAFRTAMEAGRDPAGDPTVDTAATTGAIAVTSHPTSPPGWLHAIVKRALAADPAARFPSMDDLVAALARDHRQRVFVAVAATALLVGAIGGAVAYRASTREDRCDAGLRRATAWNDTRATSVRTALGESAWVPTAVARFGEVASAWQASYRRVCEATRVRGDQSDRLLELRMRCLDRVLDRFDALAAALVGPLEPATRIEAVSAVAQLPESE